MLMCESEITNRLINEEPFEERCQKAARIAVELGVAHLIASDPATVRWLTGRSQEIEYGPLYPFSAGTFVVLNSNGGGSIVCPVEDSASGPDITGLALQTYEAYSLGPLLPFQNALRVLDVHGSVAIEAHAFAAALAHDRSWVDATEALRSLRIVKDAAELRILRHASTIVSVGQRTFREAAEPGLSEIELFSQIHAAMEQAAGQRVPVFVDLMSGERVVEVGRPPTDRIIENDELVLCDLLARVNGYWANSCTTISVGHADEAAHHLHDTCLRAMDVGIKAAEPGISAGHLDALIRNEMAEAGYSFPHHSGHGVGVSFHEEPRIVPAATILLKPGMVITLEPAGFSSRIGARFEHTLEITESGARVLTDYDLTLN
jgi:Xaa-Pro aminopeptidase